MSTYTSPLNTSLRTGEVTRPGSVSAGFREPNIVTRKLIYGAGSATDVNTGYGYFVCRKGDFGTMETVAGLTDGTTITGVLKASAVIADILDANKPQYAQRAPVNTLLELANVVEGRIRVWAGSAITGASGYKLAVSTAAIAVPGSSPSTSLMPGALIEYTGTAPANSVDVTNVVELNPSTSTLNAKIGDLVEVSLSILNR